MKIAIDARIITSGTGRYIERLLRYLEELDTTNDYFILVRKADISYYKPHNPRFKVIQADYQDYSFSEQIGLARLLYSLKPDLVHFCMPQQPLLYLRPSVTSILDLNLLRITSNDTMNPIELRVKKAIFKTMLHIVARRSRHIITISNYSKQDIKNTLGVAAKSITVTYPAADRVTAKPVAIPSLQDTQFIMYVGRAEPYKNNRGLVKAHHELLQQHPNLHLAIVGPIDDHRAADKKWVKQHGYKNVVFLGKISDAQLAWMYTHCQAYVFPSYMEGFGLPGLEAMSYGAPVASSSASCLPEVYGDAALYFDPASTKDMARTINKILLNHSLRDKMADKGRRQARLYSWRRMAEQTLTIYKQSLPKAKTD